MKVGTKELKNRLSHYLRKVRAGERVYVADRDQIVAEIRPVAAAGDAEEAALGELAAAGVITRGDGEHQDFAPIAMKRGVSISRMITLDRD